MSQPARHSEIQQRLRFETVLADVCADFVTVAPAELDFKIENAQRLICQSLALDHSSLWQASESDSDVLVMTHAYRDSNLRPLPSRPNGKEYFPWALCRILKKETVCVPKVESLPPEASTDKESWLQYGIRSSLVFPLSVGGGPVFGAIAFDSVKERAWPAHLQRRLQTLAHVFSQALDRRNTESKVRESENRFRLVADTAPVLIWMSGADKLCTYFNKPWLDFTGRTLEQELGNGWAEGVHAEDFQKCLDTYIRSFDQRERFGMEYRLRRHDGEYRWILDIGVPRFGEGRDFLGYIGIAVDVTERKLANQALHASEERLRLAQMAANIGAFDLNLRTGVNSWNPELEGLYGLPPGKFSGTQKAFLRLVHPDDRQAVSELIEGAVNSEKPSHGEWRVIWPDGSVHWIAGYAQMFTDESGEPFRLVGIDMDITERKVAEQALSEMTRKLIQAQEQERSRIGRELHDDIVQRLAMLTLDVEQLRENPPDTERRAQEIQNALSEITDDVQALSHDLHSLKLEYLGVVGGMKSWCKEFSDRRKIQIEFRSDVHSTLPLEAGLTLFRILQEGIHNVVKHSGAKRAEVQLREDTAGIHLTIRDSGKGFDISAAMEGTGLGLVSMRERVRLVSGTVTIESKPKGGTLIHVCVPVPAERNFQQRAG